MDSCCGGSHGHGHNHPVDTVTTAYIPADDPPFELIYWPGIPGRGELIRLLFEEAAVPYTDHSQNPSEVIPTIKGLIAPDSLGDEANPPVFAPPALKHGEMLLHQTSNILMYLAPRLSLVPVDSAGLFHLNQIVLTILDGLVDELHETHHPTAVSLTYEEQLPEAKKRAKNFIEERLPKFLGYVQRLLKSPISGNGPWLYGGRLTYADLVLFQCLDGTKFAFPKTVEKLEKSGKYAGVFKLYETVKQRPRIKAYLESDRRTPYSNGIWRHYPELEEE